jgi:hypothetical protein
MSFDRFVLFDYVSKAMPDRDTLTYSIAAVYVVNYKFRFPHPGRLTYAACSKSMGYTKVCANSREFGRRIVILSLRLFTCTNLYCFWWNNITHANHYGLKWGMQHVTFSDWKPRNSLGTQRPPNFPCYRPLLHRLLNAMSN